MIFQSLNQLTQPIVLLRKFFLNYNAPVLINVVVILNFMLLLKIGIQ